VKLLIKFNADINERSHTTTPLCHACVKGHVDVVKILLQHNADVNADWQGARPLQIACQYGQVEVVKLLLEHGADVDCVDGAGMIFFSY
jgi:ankyrin repeat protein